MEDHIQDLLFINLDAHQTMTDSPQHSPIERSPFDGAKTPERPSSQTAPLREGDRGGQESQRERRVNDTRARSGNSTFGRRIAKRGRFLGYHGVRIPHFGIFSQRARSIYSAHARDFSKLNFNVSLMFL